MIRAVVICAGIEQTTGRGCRLQVEELQEESGQIMDEIPVRPLNRQEFAAFGEVIEPDSTVETIAINDGYALRYNDLATVDVRGSGGRPLINIFRSKPRPLPIAIHMMERHPLGSQAFMSLQMKKFLVVVAPPGESVDPENLSAFMTNGFQGVNYARGVWHFPLISLDEEQDFLVIDRGGPENNCEEIFFSKSEIRMLKYPAPDRPSQHTFRSGSV